MLRRLQSSFWSHHLGAWRRRQKLAAIVLKIVLGLGLGLVMVAFLGNGIDEMDLKYLDPTLLKLKAPGPDTFCPPFRPGVGFTERITFIEVSGEPCLFPRSVCGIESTARTNPHMQIYVYINTVAVKKQKQYNVHKPGKIRSCYVTRVLSRYPNVHIIREDLTTYVRGSKFWRLFQNGSHFDRSEWSYVHLSDALRLILLEKYGGFYLDSDIVTFRPLHCLRNAASYLNEVPHIENGVIVFDKDHPFLRFFTKYLLQVYQPDQRMSMGPPRLATAFQLYCGLNITEKLRTGAFACRNGTQLSLLDPDSFFPVKHFEMYTFFTETFGYFDHDVLLRRSYLAHVYGAGWGKPAPLTSLYASLARHYCPATWNATFEDRVPFGF